MQSEQPTQPEPSSYPGAPHWVKLSGIAAGILVLLVAVVIAAGIGGRHGPGRHMPSAEATDADAGLPAHLREICAAGDLDRQSQHLRDVCASGANQPPAGDR